MHSIVLTVHNKDWMIKDVMDSVYNHTVGEYELIIILDGCSDRSEEIVLSNLKDNTKIFYAENVFETKANNIGLKQSQGDKVIIVQDDMIINEYSWNKNLSKPFVFDDVFAVTAKTAHNWELNDSLIVLDVDHANQSNTDRDTFAIRSCVNRGPLMIDHNVLSDLNYLDEIYSPQVMDDHDLCFRAYLEYGKRCGYYFIDFTSEDSWGSTRKDGVTAPWFDDTYFKNKKTFYDRFFKEINTNKIKENRKI
jgi:glycosyltransferase involved in cell wall biosynthesis